MARILVRAHKHPLRVASAEATLAKNLIGNNVGNLVFSQAVFRLLSTERNEVETARLVQRQSADRINATYDHARHSAGQRVPDELPRLAQRDERPAREA